MTEEQIIEGNKLIAEFMELYPFDDMRYGKMYRNPTSKTNQSVFGDAGLQYNKSWDWIMPVCHKFANMEMESTQFHSWCSELQSLVGEWEIGPLWEGLVKAINWYNKNKKA